MNARLHPIDIEIYDYRNTKAVICKIQSIHVPMVDEEISYNNPGTLYCGSLFNVTHIYGVVKSRKTEYGDDWTIVKLYIELIPVW